MALPIPSTLIVQSLDVSALTATLASFAEKIAAVETRMSELQIENAQLRQEVAECTRKSEVSQNQYSALYEVVTGYAGQLKAVQDDFIGRAEVKIALGKITDTQEQQRFFMEELDGRKIDAHSTLLENRVRETSEESCTRFMMRHDREAKDWTMGQILVVENKLTKHANEGIAQARRALEDESRRIDGKVDELSAQVKATNTDVDGKLQMIFATERATLVKLESHERAIDAAELCALAFSDKVFTNFRLFLSTLGVEWGEVEELFRDNTAATATAVPDEESDVAEHFQRDLHRHARAQDFSRGWKMLKVSNPKILATTMQQLIMDDDGVLERRRIEVGREERLKELERITKARKAKQKQQQQQAAASGQIPESARLLMSASLFSTFRRVIEAHFQQNLSSLKEEVCTDVATQMQAFNRELRQKIGTSRAVELIEEYATKQVTTLLEDVQARLQRLVEDAVTHDELRLVLSSKVDQRQLADKADATALQTLSAALLEQVAASIDAAGTKLRAQFDGKLRDLDVQKLDRHDSRLLSAINAIESGGASGGQSALQGARRGGKKDVCLSCSRPLATDSGVVSDADGGSAGTQQLSARRSAADLLQRDRADELQVVQELIHMDQMAAAARAADSGSAKRSDQLSRFELREWVETVNRTYPKPDIAATAVTTATATATKQPRPPSARQK